MREYLMVMMALEMIIGLIANVALLCVIIVLEVRRRLK